MEAQFVALGLFVGLLVGMTGVGAGSLVTPALVLSGISPAVAIGTDLAYAAASKAAGTLAHRSQRTVDLRIAGLLALGSVPAAGATIAALALSGAPLRSTLITLALSVALVLTAVALLGVLVTVSSIGAGALGAVLLVALYPNLPAVRIAGTDIAHAVPLTLAAGLGHFWLGNVDLGLAATLLAGSIPGIVAGSFLAGRLPDALVRRALAFVLLYAGTRLAFASF